MDGEEYSLEAGTILKNKYEVIRVLGRGGFSVTYLAKDISSSTEVAIKQLCSKQNGFSLSKERFQKEMKPLEQLSNLEEIVRVLDFFEEAGEIYMVMEYVKGVTLLEYVKKEHGCLTWEETKGLFLPIIRTLKLVHERGIIHRDISPENIMMLPERKLKILDFGAWKDVGENTAVGMEQEQTTTAFLKQGYAPIEQYQKKGNLGPWTDVYGLCATIFFCLTGEVPMDAPGRAISRDEIDLSAYGLSLPEAVAQTLQKGLEIRVQNRVQSMEELETLFAEKKELKQSWLKYFVTIVFVLLLLVGGGIFLDKKLPPIKTEDEKIAERELAQGEYLLSETDDIKEILADAKVSTVRIPSGSHVITDLITLTKKIIIEPDAMLEVGHLIMEDGGRIQIDGTLNMCNSILQLSFANCFEVSSSGSFLQNENTLVWYTAKEAQEQELILENETGKNILLNIEERFKDAVSVHSLEELLTAQETANAIRIDSDIVIDRDIQFRKSTYISEGVSVKKAKERNWVCCDGDLVINHGYFDPGIYMCKNVLFINYGDIKLRSEACETLWQLENSIFLNFGEVLLDNCSRVWEGANFYNSGVVEAYDFWLFGANAFNYGTINAEAGKEGLHNTGGSHLYNFGQIYIKEDARIRNNGYLENSGYFEVDNGASFDNNVFYNRKDFVCEFSGSLDDQIGIYYGNGEFRINGISSVAIWKTGDFIEVDSYTPVHDFAELQSALENDEVREILIASDIQITENIDITKPLYIAKVLEVSENCNILFENVYAVLLEKGELSARHLQLDNALLINEKGTLAINDGECLLDNSSGLIFVGGDARVSKLDMTLLGDSVLSLPFGNAYEMNEMRLSMDKSEVFVNADVTFYDSYFLLEGESRWKGYSRNVIWDGCELNLSDDTYFYQDFSDVKFQNDSTIHNYGTVLMDAWIENTLVLDAVSFNNYGKFEANNQTYVAKNSTIYNEGELLLPNLKNE